MLGAMGFSTVAAAATAVEKTVEAVGSYRQGKQLKQVAEMQAQNAENRAGAMVNTAMENHRREQRNAQMQTARARADAGANNLLREGSTLNRETDLATRLEDEITARSRAALQEADTVRLQGAMEAWDTRLQAKAAKHRALGSLLGAGVSAVGALGSWSGTQGKAETNRTPQRTSPPIR